MNDEFEFIIFISGGWVVGLVILHRERAHLCYVGEFWPHRNGGFDPHGNTIMTTQWTKLLGVVFQQFCHIFRGHRLCELGNNQSNSHDGKMDLDLPVPVIQTWRKWLMRKTPRGSLSAGVLQFILQSTLDMSQFETVGIFTRWLTEGEGSSTSLRHFTLHTRFPLDWLTRSGTTTNGYIAH